MRRILFFVCIISCVSGCGQQGNMQVTGSGTGSADVVDERRGFDCTVFNKDAHQLTIYADSAKSERILISGTVYQSDGKTPAARVQLYFYHPGSMGDQSAVPRQGNLSLRDLVTTNELGKYIINTIRPHPGSTAPARIHCVINAPMQKRCYVITDFVFNGDEHLTATYWKSVVDFQLSTGIDDDPDYGGIILERNAAGILEGKRDIALFDEYDLPELQSGKQIGTESPAFSPQHAAGPDKGSHACPMCKFGYHPGVMVFLNTDDDWDNIAVICKRLEEESVKRKSQRFKGYLIYTNPGRLSAAELEAKLERFATGLSIRNMAITYVPSYDDEATEMNLNQINPKTRNTIIVYNQRTVFDKFVDFVPTEKNLSLLMNSVDEAKKIKKQH